MTTIGLPTGLIDELVRTIHPYLVTHLLSYSMEDSNSMKNAVSRQHSGKDNSVEALPSQQNETPNFDLIYSNITKVLTFSDMILEYEQNYGSYCFEKGKDKDQKTDAESLQEQKPYTVSYDKAIFNLILNKKLPGAIHLSIPIPSKPFELVMKHNEKFIGDGVYIGGVINSMPNLTYLKLYTPEDHTPIKPDNENLDIRLNTDTSMSDNADICVSGVEDNNQDFGSLFLQSTPSPFTFKTLDLSEHHDIKPSILKVLVARALEGSFINLNKIICTDILLLQNDLTHNFNLFVTEINSSIYRHPQMGLNNKHCCFFPTESTVYKHLLTIEDDNDEVVDEQPILTNVKKATTKGTKKTTTGKKASAKVLPTTNASSFLSSLTLPREPIEIEISYFSNPDLNNPKNGVIKTDRVPLLSSLVKLFPSTKGELGLEEGENNLFAHFFWLPPFAGTASIEYPMNSGTVITIPTPPILMTRAKEMIIATHGTSLPLLGKLLAEAPGLSSITNLHTSYCGLEPNDIKVICGTKYMVNLKSWFLGENDMNDKSLSTILSSPSMSHLERLTTPCTLITIKGALGHVIKATNAKALKELSLVGEEAGDEITQKDMIKLFSSDNVKNLEKLHLSNFAIKRKAFLGLLDNVYPLNNLKSLSLTEMCIEEDEDVDNDDEDEDDFHDEEEEDNYESEFEDDSTLPQYNASIVPINHSKLTHLDLSSGNITDKDLLLFSQSPHFINLEELRVEFCDNVTDIGIRHLRRSPYLPNLTKMGLYGTETGQDYWINGDWEFKSLRRQ